VLTGYEKLQKAFDLEADTDALMDARDWCQQIVIVRFMELIHRAHNTAYQRNLSWGSVPIYCTEHDYDFLVVSSNGT
jgi:hypothetical protein